MPSEPDQDRVRGATYQDAMAFAATLPPGRLIGIDAGTKTYGLALSDVLRSVASPMETIRRGKFTTDLQYLLKLSDQQGVVGFVLGLPVNLNGTEGPRAQATRAFARNMNLETPRPVLLWDERMTTQQAERLLIEADASRAKRADVIDKLAATLILQSLLDRIRIVSDLE
jgi:putative holliday junction resolvase